MSDINVLMVEDYKLMRVGLRSLFEEYPEIKIIAEAQNVKEAIEKTKIYKPEVVLMDIGLPDISGIEVTKRILEQFNKIKIIMLTSHISEREVLDSLSAGASAYVLKDISTDILTMIIKTVRDGALWLDPQVTPIIREKNSGII